MPEPAIIERAHKDAREGKAPATQAGEFVREEFHHLREGKHGARSPQQAIAIGLSKARRAGVELPPPQRGKTSEKVRRQAGRDSAKGHNGHTSVSHKRSRAVTNDLRPERRAAISRQASAAARRRNAQERTAAVRRAVRTKTPAVLVAAGRKAARIRPAHEMS